MSMTMARDPVLGSPRTNAKRQFQAESHSFSNGPTISDVLLQSTIPHQNLHDPTMGVGIDRLDPIGLATETDAEHLPLDLLQDLYPFESQPLEAPYMQWPWWPMQTIEETKAHSAEMAPQQPEGDGLYPQETFFPAVALPPSEPCFGSFQIEVSQQEASEAPEAPNQGTNNALLLSSFHSVASAFGVLEGSKEPDPIPKNYLIGQSATFPRSYHRRKYPWRNTKEKSNQLGLRGIHKTQLPKQTQGTKRYTALINGRGSSSSDTVDALTCESPDEDGASEIDNTRRRRLTPDETEYLLRKFHQMEKPSAKDRLRFADDLKLTPRTIQIWFQNRRAKLKKETRLVRELRSKELSEEGDSSEEELDANSVAQGVTATRNDLKMAEKKHQAAEGTNEGVAAACVDPQMPQLQTVSDPLSQMYCTDWNGVCSDGGNSPFFSLTTTPSFETMLSQQVAVDVGLLQGIDNDIGSNTCSYDPRFASSESFCSAHGLDRALLIASDDWQLQTLFEFEPRYIFEESFPFSSPSHSTVSTSGVSEEQTSSTSDERKADRAPEPQAPIQDSSRGQRSTVPGSSLSRIKNPVPRHQRALTLVEMDS